jgi:glycosyltransferase involved in cell wall biosynthesis
MLKHYVYCIHQEILNKGLIGGLHSSYCLFINNTVKPKIKSAIILPTHNNLNRAGIAIISGCEGDTKRYRCFHQKEELEHFGINADVFDYYGINFKTILDYYDIFILHRIPLTKKYRDLIISGKQRGKIFIFESDDLIFDENYAQYIRILDILPPGEVDLYLNDLRQFNETMQLCDYALCSTEYLKTELESHGKKTYINLNAVSDEMVELAKKAVSERKRIPGSTVKIGYMSGTRTHNADFIIAEDALIRILTEFENVELVIGGYLDLSEKFSPFKDRIIRQPFMDWKKLPKYIADFDINISPFEDTPFSNAKSDLKYFEAALLQVPTISSNVGGYTSQIQNFKNGFLVSTSQEWYNALKLLITDEELRLTIGRNAESDVLNKRTTKITGKNLVQIIEEIKRDAQKKKMASGEMGMH